jgi:membrane protease YdiL (CAAX protease family)
MVDHFLIIILFSPILEEILFRGILGQILNKDSNKLIFIFFSCLSFLSIHIDPNADKLYYISILGLSLLSTISLLKTKSVIGSIGIHFSYNLAFYIFYYLMQC